MAGRILRLFLGSGAAPEALSVLDELYRDRVHRFGEIRARRWYWRQALAIAFRWRSVRKELARRPGIAGFEDQGGWQMTLDSIQQDLRYGLRQLWNRPTFSIIALAMLALGIGANTAVFSVVQTLLLKPLPFEEPDRILRLWESRGDGDVDRANMTVANFWDFQDMNQAFEGLGALRRTQTILTGSEYPERIRGAKVTAGFFGQVLGVRPVLGRTLLPGEDQPGEAGNPVLLAEEFWLGRFAGDPEILGKTLTLDDEVFTVVGVLPSGWPWLNDADVFTPLVRDPNAARRSFVLFAIGRLKAAETPESGLADMESVARRLEELYPDINHGIGVIVGTTEEWVASEDLRRTLSLLFAAVNFLLLIVCVNLANLLLAKATGKERDTAIRAALGAERIRLLRQAITETLLLSLMGAGIGILLAIWGLDFLRTLDPGGFPRLGEVSLNWWVILYTMGVATMTGVLSGAMPALQSSGTSAAETLKNGGRNVSVGRTQRRTLGALVATEMALSLTLLVGACLLIRSFTELLGVDRGFQAENLLVAGVTLPASYDSGEVETFLRQFEERVRSRPEITAISAVSARPIAGGSTEMGILNPEKPGPEGEPPWAEWRFVTPSYLETLGVPLLRGRFLDDTDRFDRERVQNFVISERLAELLWPGENPVGKPAHLWAGQGDLPGEVVGVVGDILEQGLDSDPTLAVYLPYFGAPSSPEFIIHAGGDPSGVVPILREIIREMDPTLPLVDITTMDEIVGSSLKERRFLMSMVGAFAGMALCLVLAGIFGVQSYNVSRQTSEIGIRVALGAERSLIVRGIMLQAMGPAVVGISLGLGGAVVLSRLIESFLFQVTAMDAFTYLAVASLLLVTALLSCWIPARRALKVDPVVALGTE